MLWPSALVDMMYGLHHMDYTTEIVNFERSCFALLCRYQLISGQSFASFASKACA